jgi:rhamnogalacturonyl hydrolase YesR
MMKKGLLLLLIALLALKFSIPLFDSSPYTIREDRYGVPIVDYGWLMGRYVGERRYPVAIAVRADRYYASFKRNGSIESHVKFLNNIDWLYRNRVEINDFVIWPSDFEYPFYGCNEGWPSAMAQGYALKDFLHAYELTGNEEYLRLTKRILNSYKARISEGGILYVDSKDGGYWYAEYACGDPPQVLNGHWFALDGLHYYYSRTGDDEAKELYDMGVEELLRHLHEFDSGSWSYYDLEGYPSDESYHNLHLDILETLYKQTGNSTFLEYHEKWSTYNYSNARFYYLVIKDLVLKFLL